MQLRRNPDIEAAFIFFIRFLADISTECQIIINSFMKL